MPNLEPILPYRVLPDEYTLRTWITEASMLGAVTRTQWAAVIERFTSKLPATLALSCRTRKGVIYIFERRGTVITHRLSHRAKWLQENV
jgi:hypothetical protein